jgi:hypothetical protein
VSIIVIYKLIRFLMVCYVFYCYFFIITFNFLKFTINVFMLFFTYMSLVKIKLGGEYKNLFYSATQTKPNWKINENLYTYFQHLYTI